MRKLVEKLNTQKGVQVDYRILSGGDHVLAQHADPISGHVEDYVKKTMAHRAMALAAD